MNWFRSAGQWLLRQREVGLAILNVAIIATVGSIDSGFLTAGNWNDMPLPAFSNSRAQIDRHR
jgi:hypothetical protein